MPNPAHRSSRPGRDRFRSEKEIGPDNETFRLAILAGVLTMAIGGLALLGWRFDSEVLVSIISGWAPIRPSTAAGFLLCGMVLMLTGSRFQLHDGSRRILVALSAAIGLLGIGIVARYVLGFQAEIRSELDAIAPGVSLLPDQIAPSTALTFGFTGLALTAANWNLPSKIRLSLLAGLGITVAVIGSFAAAGYFFDVAFGYHSRNYTGMAFPTAMGFVSLGGGLLAFAWKKGKMRWTLTPAVTGGFAVGIGLMLLAIGAAYDFTDHLRRSAGLIAHRQEVLKEIEEVTSWVNRVGSRRIGVFLTPGESLQSPEPGIRQITFHDLGEIRRLTSGNPRQQGRVAELETLLTRLFGEEERTTASDSFAAPAAEALRAEISSVETIRTLLAAMREEEYALLANDRAAAASIAHATFLFLPLGTFLSVAVLLTGILFLNAGTLQRKETEEALREREQRFRHERAVLRALIDSIPDLIFIKDRESVFLGCNLAFQRKFAISENELIGKTDFDIAPSERAEAFRRRDRELFASGQVQRAEEWIAFPDGGGGFFDTLKTPFYDADGNLLGLVGVSRDITDRKKIDAQLRMTVERMRLAAQAGRVGMWELDLVSGKGAWDDQMFAIFGQRPVDSEEGAERWFRVMHPDDIPKCKVILEEAMHSRRDAFDVEFRIHRCSDGELRFIQAKGIIERGEDGHSVRMVGINRDVTEERLHEREMAEALAHEQTLAREAEAGNRAKSEFLAVMSHEIRTPMNGILGFADILTRTPDLPSDCREHAEIILRTGEAMLRILDDILDFSRLEAGGVQVEAAPFSPRKLIADLVTLLEPAAMAKSLKFGASIEAGVPDVVTGDSGRIRQILLNLAGNALKFAERGEVSLSLAPAREPCPPGKAILRFSVRDTGPGIESEHLEHLFKPFAQGDSSISRRFGGTGLGLSISRRITELLDGNLSVDSQPGKGSEFVLTLPFDVSSRSIEPPAAAEAEALDSTFASRHPLSVLIVEDDKVNLKLICLLVKKLGYHPQVASNGVEAVDVFHRKRPDCVLMDLQMPKMDGAEATRRIRASEAAEPGGPRAFVSAITANIFPADRQRCFEAGMDNYLNKPIKLDNLARVLAAASDAVSRQ